MDGPVTGTARGVVVAAVGGSAVLADYGWTEARAWGVVWFGLPTNS